MNYYVASNSHHSAIEVKRFRADFTNYANDARILRRRFAACVHIFVPITEQEYKEFQTLMKKSDTYGHAFSQAIIKFMHVRLKRLEERVGSIDRNLDQVRTLI